MADKSIARMSIGATIILAAILLCLSGCVACIYRSAQYDERQDQILQQKLGVQRMLYAWEYWPDWGWSAIGFSVLLVVVGGLILFLDVELPKMAKPKPV